MLPNEMKKIIFVSTGRCGTKRICELLEKALPDSVAVIHQMEFSRLANILGTIRLSSGGAVDFSFGYELLTKRYTKNKSAFISTDPLSALLLPDKTIRSADTCIIHLDRPSDEFARSMFDLSRTRLPSLIAHNFIPFWQPGIYPFENLLNKNILMKYEAVNKKKNSFFNTRYEINPHYRVVPYLEVFQTRFLENIVRDFLGINIDIPSESLRKRSNESRRQ